MNQGSERDYDEPVRRDGWSSIAIVLLAAVLIGIMINYFV
jgi:VanZ family protein